MLTQEERDKHLTELRIAVTGLDGTDDDGLVGDVREIKDELKRLNGSVKTNTTYRRLFTWIGSATWLLIIATCCKVLFTGSLI